MKRGFGFRVGTLFLLNAKCIIFTAPLTESAHHKLHIKHSFESQAYFPVKIFKGSD